ncbi:glycosyltransferase [Segetibacter koreensis]|uniref:glycosyltransferase n=1 Tax=Segetibacter koreensis TaxID=398037 RepID=UPI00037F428E|nr:glycosyltransferase [Segetibacter koreensis]
MQRLSGVVILYNPDSGTVENILSYLPHVQKLYVVDNSKNTSLVSNELSALKTVNYLHDGKNEGIAKRLNQASRLATEDGCEWLLTMDQDSYFSQENISAYTTCLEKLPNKEQTAMTGVEYIAKRNKGNVCMIKETKSLITSGNDG